MAAKDDSDVTAKAEVVADPVADTSAVVVDDVIARDESETTASLVAVSELAETVVEFLHIAS